MSTANAPSPAPPLTADLARLRDELVSVQERARQLTAGLSTAQLSWRPGPARWSIAECLAHLVATTEATVPNLAAAMAGATPMSEPERYRPGLLGRLLRWMMEPPSRLRTKTQDVFLPHVPTDPATVPEQFANSQAELLRQLEAAKGLAINRVMASSAANEKLRLSLGDWFSFLAAHQRRHLWQAERVRQEAGFPAP